MAHTMGLAAAAVLSLGGFPTCSHLADEPTVLASSAMRIKGPTTRTGPDVTFWNNGSLSADLALDGAATIELTISARGNEWLGEWPKVAVDLDSRTVAVLTIDSSQLKPYTIRTPTQSATSAVLRLSLTNGVSTPGRPLASRNLTIQTVTVRRRS